MILFGEGHPTASPGFQYVKVGFDRYAGCIDQCTRGDNFDWRRILIKRF